MGGRGRGEEQQQVGGGKEEDAWLPQPGGQLHRQLHPRARRRLQLPLLLQARSHHHLCHPRARDTSRDWRLCHPTPVSFYWSFQKDDDQRECSGAGSVGGKPGKHRYGRQAWACLVLALLFLLTQSVWRGKLLGSCLFLREVSST